MVIGYDNFVLQSRIGYSEDLRPEPYSESNPFLCD